MSVGAVIYNILSTDTSVAALVSTRITPFGAEQSTSKPYVTYQVISKTPNKHKDRTLDLIVYRIQVDCFAATYNDCTTLADAVCNALAYKTGTFASTNVDIIVFEDENDLFSDQPEVYRKEQDYFIRIKS